MKHKWIHSISFNLQNRFKRRMIGKKTDVYWEYILVVYFKCKEIKFTKKVRNNMFGKCQTKIN